MLARRPDQESASRPAGAEAPRPTHDSFRHHMTCHGETRRSDRVKFSLSYESWGVGSFIIGEGDFGGPEGRGG